LNKKTARGPKNTGKDKTGDLRGRCLGSLPCWQRHVTGAGVKKKGGRREFVEKCQG